MEYVIYLDEIKKENSKIMIGLKTSFNHRFKKTF